MKWIIPSDSYDVDIDPAFAYVGLNGEVYAQDWDGVQKQVTMGSQNASWPRWSPDKNWLLYFHVTEGGPTVSIAHLYEQEERVLGSFEEHIPIFAQWSPNAQKVLLVMQGLELELWIFDINNLGQGRCLEKGGPIFFNWSDDSQSVFVHAVQKTGSVLKQHFVDIEQDLLISQQPGLFCAPIVQNKEVFFVEAEDKIASLYVYTGEGKKLLHQREGLISMSKSPDGHHCLLSGRDRLELLHVSSQTIQPLLQDTAQSLWWKPDSSGFIFSKVNRAQARMHWYALDIEEQEARELKHFWPTRDQIFVLHFFEQFGLVQSLVDKAGERLLFGGYKQPQGTRNSSPKAEIYSLNLNTEETTCVAQGLFPTMPALV